MSTHVYPRGAILADYARGGGGLAVMMVPVLFAEPLVMLQMIFMALALLFAGYVARTWQRARTRVEMDASGIRLIGPLGKSIDWPALRELKLAFYSTRRDRGEGWMQLTLRDDRHKITIDSNLEGFDEVLARCVAMARRNEIALSEATAENLVAAGIDEGPPAASH